MVALDPRAGAVLVDFFFPDGEAVFDIVDDVAAAEEGVASMMCCDTDPDCDISDGEVSDAVNDSGIEQREFFFGFG